MRRRHFIQNLATATAAVGLTAPTELLGETKSNTPVPTTGPSRNDPLGQRGPSLPAGFYPPCGNTSHDNCMHQEAFLPFCRQCSRSPEEQALLDEVGKEMGGDFDAAVIQTLAEDGLVSKAWARNKLGL